MQVAVDMKMHCLTHACDLVAAEIVSNHEARSARLWFWPSYSPDLNSLALVFSKLKQLLRSAAART
jgi:hypothetical protein